MARGPKNHPFPERPQVVYLLLRAATRVMPRSPGGLAAHVPSAGDPLENTVGFAVWTRRARPRRRAVCQKEKIMNRVTAVLTRRAIVSVLGGFALVAARPTAGVAQRRGAAQSSAVDENAKVE